METEPASTIVIQKDHFWLAKWRREVLAAAGNVPRGAETIGPVKSRND